MRRTSRYFLKACAGTGAGILLILCLEGILRIAGAARPPEFLSTHQVRGRTLVSFSPDYIRRYFRYQPPGAARMDARTLTFQAFMRDRDTDVIRIVALGGSSTQGYPHPSRLSFPKIAERMLGLRHPDKRFEVINAGVVALNSFAVLDIGLKSLKELKPDVVVVYAGHNEFHGIFGSATAGFLGGHETMIRAVQWLWRSRLYTGIESMMTDRAEGPEANGAPMEILAKGRHVRPGDSAHRVAARQFKNNLQRLIDAAGSAGVAVIVMTPESNLADQPPLASVRSDGTGFTDLDSIRSMADLDERGKRDDLDLTARRMINADSLVSAGHYYLGRAMMAADTRVAESSFRAALECDALHFRACGDIVRAAESLPERKNPAVLVVRTGESMRRYWNGRIPGQDLFYEHVHPTYAGNMILAWEATRAVETITNLTTDRPPFPHIGYFQRIPQFSIDRYQAAGRIGKLAAEWPFAGRPEMDPIRRRAADDRDRAWAGMDTIARGMALQDFGNDGALMFANIGLAYLREGNAERAIPYLSVSADERPYEDHPAALLGSAWMMLDRPEVAERHLARAVNLNPANSFAQANLGATYLRLDRPDDARLSFQRALDINPFEQQAKKGMAILADLQKMRDRPKK